MKYWLTRPALQYLLPGTVSMWHVFTLRGLFLTIFLGFTLAGFAWQSDSLSQVSPKDPVKIGLALSGGGAKGFAHIGILKVFDEENIPVHMITGTSIGAVVGSLYAMGYTPDEIREVALHTDWLKLFDDNYEFNPHNFSNSVSGKDTYLFTFPFHKNRLQLPVALTDGQNVSMMLYRLMLQYHDIEDFSDLPIPFACVATNLATGEAQLFDTGFLPDAVRASFAIPTFFKPVTIDGQSYIDGSISRNIPAEDVRGLGADIVIASDVGEPVKPVDSLYTFVHILRQAVGYRQQDSDKQQIEMVDFYIQPDIRQYSSFSYDKIEALIQKGEEAARKAIPAIKEYINENATALPVEKSVSPVDRDTLLITDVRFNNIEGRLARRASMTFDVSPPSRMTVTQIERKVKLLYRSGLFSQVSYRLGDNLNGEGKLLTIAFQPKEQEYAGFSIRYDSKYKAALLFGISLNDNFIWSDRLVGRLRVGEILELSATYSAPVSLAPLTQFNLGLGIQRSPIEYYLDGNALSTIGVEQLRLNPHLSLHLSSDFRFQTGLETELYNLNEAVGNTLVLENTHFLLQGFAELSYHTLNRPYYPTRGQHINLRAAVSNAMWGSSENFFQLTGSWLGSLRLAPGLNFTNRFVAGYTSTASLPLHYNYYLGGLAANKLFPWHQYPFMGYDAQQLRSTNLMALQSKLRFRLTNNTYAEGGWNIAHLSDQWTFNIQGSKLWQGFFLSAGALTLIGPVELALSTPDLRNGYTVKINVGYHF